MQQFVQGFLPRKFESIWLTNANRNPNDRPYRLRNHEELFIPISRLSTFSNHPFYVMPKLWEEFNVAEIKIQREKLVFNILLKKHLIESLSTIITCTRLLCPACHLQPDPTDS